MRPIPGQLSTNYRVWCDVKSWSDWPVGTLFLINAYCVVQPQGKDYLRAEPSRLWVRIEKEEAERLIAARGEVS